MQPRDWIALVAVIAAPLAALAGALVNSRLSERAHKTDVAERGQQDALVAFGHMRSLLLDGEPTLVVTGNLREFKGPEEAVEDLYKQWRVAREPLVLLSVTHPRAEVRQLALSLQAEVELVLRQTQDALREPGQAVGDIGPARASYERAIETSVRLGSLLSPWAPSI